MSGASKILCIIQENFYYNTGCAIEIGGVVQI